MSHLETTDLFQGHNERHPLWMITTIQQSCSTFDYYEFLTAIENEISERWHLTIMACAVVILNLSARQLTNRCHDTLEHQPMCRLFVR